MRCYTNILRTKGVKGLVLYTKSCNILLMQSVGGTRLHDSGQLGPRVARDRTGIPRVIPRAHRILIRQGDRKLLKIWLSWFSIYRILTFPGTLKLSTITQKGVE